MVVVDKSANYDKTHINFFFTIISTNFSERELKKVMRDTLTRAGMDNGQVFFHWFLPSMRMQVIVDSSFRPPGFSPYMRRKERRVQGLDYRKCDNIIFSDSIFQLHVTCVPRENDSRMNDWNLYIVLFDL